ncbi:di/tricarboxylate transporter [Shimia isoporae]|uniref:Di/tricarboxylate transporter n=1 Tax=Shimia isoporae TaxID=647720 RepID=A0A4R1NMC3_9RHOB|nr:SLC13 family permease [Shimia isoporae]TCL09557.1 di/tricarboxylate transporter [Shimia isoporae]
MTSDVLFVFILIGIAGAMMASNRVRFDLVALIVVVALILSGILTADQALAGFGSPVVIMVAALLIIGEMLDRTGVAHAIGNLILKRGGQNENRLVIYLMLGAAFLGCVMSSTAIVAIFIPIILRITAETGISQSRLLLPMSYAALISGMLTLIATPPNLVVSDSLQDAGYAPLGFFSFFPIGLVILLAAVVYMLAFARRLLPQSEESSAAGAAPAHAQTPSVALLDAYNLLERFYVFEVAQAPSLSFKEIFKGLDARILARRRPSKGQKVADSFVPEMALYARDRLLVVGEEAEIEKLNSRPEFNMLNHVREDTAEWRDSVGIADVLVHPNATIVGQSIRDFEFRDVYGIEVVGVVRGEDALENPFNTKLKSGDRLLLAGSWNDIEHLTDLNHDFVLLNIPKERFGEPVARHKFATALLILAAMVLLSISGLVPVVVAVLVAATAAVVFRTLTPELAYGSIHWSSIVLVAGMLPLATALQQTGGADVVVDALFDLVGDASPQVMMASLFLITAALGLVLSNTASAVLVAPIAIVASETLGVSPYPMAICVLMAASAAFSTPVSTPVVTLVVAPGGYRFADFLKIGLPLTALVGVITVWITPWFFPL